MRIDRKEMTMLALFGVGLLYLRNNNHDINRDGNKDNDDKALMLLAGAALVFFVL